MGSYLPIPKIDKETENGESNNKKVSIYSLTLSFTR